MSDHDDDDRDGLDIDVAVDFSSLLGPEPNWQTCDCGAQSARVPCWDCSRTNEARALENDRRGRSLASIPRRYDWARLGSTELLERVRAREPLETIAKKVLASQRVVFAGTSGAGKTSLAIACLRERVPHGEFMTAMKLSMARIQSKAGDGEPSDVERAMTVPLLVLDEVGREAKTMHNAVMDVIWARVDSELPTWITTGFKSTELATMYGDGMLRRLTEGATIIQLGVKL